MPSVSGPEGGAPRRFDPKSIETFSVDPTLKKVVRAYLAMEGDTELPQPNRPLLERAWKRIKRDPEQAHAEKLASVVEKMDRIQGLERESLKNPRENADEEKEYYSTQKELCETKAKLAKDLEELNEEGPKDEAESLIEANATQAKTCTKRLNQLAKSETDKPLPEDDNPIVLNDSDRLKARLQYRREFPDRVLKPDRIDYQINRDTIGARHYVMQNGKQSELLAGQDLLNAIRDEIDPKTDPVIIEFYKDHSHQGSAADASAKMPARLVEELQKKNLDHITLAPSLTDAEEQKRCMPQYLHDPKHLTNTLTRDISLFLQLPSEPERPKINNIRLAHIPVKVTIDCKQMTEHIYIDPVEVADLSTIEDPVLREQAIDAQKDAIHALTKIRRECRDTNGYAASIARGSK